LVFVINEQYVAYPNWGVADEDESLVLLDLRLYGSDFSARDWQSFPTLHNRLPQSAVSNSKRFSHLLTIHLKHVFYHQSLPKPETNAYVAKGLFEDKRFVFS